MSRACRTRSTKRYTKDFAVRISRTLQRGSCKYFALPSNTTVEYPLLHCAESVYNVLASAMSLSMRIRYPTREHRRPASCLGLMFWGEQMHLQGMTYPRWDTDSSVFDVTVQDWLSQSREHVSSSGCEQKALPLAGLLSFQ
ncbi:hypothetical protein MRX96_021360 [Rhipicephalus microplus]